MRFDFSAAFSGARVWCTNYTFSSRFLLENVRKTLIRRFIYPRQSDTNRFPKVIIEFECSNLIGLSRPVCTGYKNVDLCVADNWKSNTSVRISFIARPTTGRVDTCFRIVFIFNVCTDYIHSFSGGFSIIIIIIFIVEMDR